MRLKTTVLILFFIAFIVSAGFAGVINWETVNQNGLGDTNNTAFYPGAVFNNYLFIGSDRSPQGGQLWRSSDGNTFSSVTTNGFGVIHNIKIVPAHQSFEGYMYAFTKDTVMGTDGYRSASGSAGDWTAVFSNGFGNWYNSSIVSSCVWSSWLYVGIDDSGMGDDIRRTDNGTSWTAVSPGFSSDKSYPEGGYNGYLYCGTYNPSFQGGELWRYSSSWEGIATNGFEDANNKKILPAYQGFNGYLYAGTENSSGAQIWRSPTGNANTWIKIYDFAANDLNNKEILSFSMPIDEYLYFSTRNSVTGTEVWRTQDGSTWEQVNTDGFGSTNNTESWLSRTLLNGYLHTGTVNSTGAHIYKVLIEIPTEENIVIEEGEVIVIGSTEGKGTINPDKGDKVTIHFKGTGDGKFTCRIFTLLGKLIYEKTIDSSSEGYFTWVPEDIASGTYIVHIEGPGIDISKKIAILR